MVAGNTESSPDLVRFAIVFKEELGHIVRRRERRERKWPAPDESGPASAALPDGTSAGGRRREPPEMNLGRLAEAGKFGVEDPVLNVVGLCLSGGGIRSASFCLGVLQALDRAGVLERVDYLSTVSGGGYIGSSLSAGMSKSGAFPFTNGANESDTAAVRHIRDYSNYLMPHGKTDVLESLVIYLRGLVANVILVLPWLMLAACITVFSNPTIADLRVPDLFGIPIRNYTPDFLKLPFDQFNISAYLALVLLALLAFWSIFRSNLLAFRRLLHSNRPEVSRKEVPSVPSTAFGYALVFLLVVAFFELQPFVLDQIWAHNPPAAAATGSAPSGLAARITAWLQHASAILAPLATAVAFFHRQLQAFTKRTLESPAKSSRIAGYLGKALLYVAAAVLPLVLWAIYFQMCWLAIRSCDNQNVCDFPHWISVTAGWLPWRISTNPFASLYLDCFLVLVLASMALKPNANSLHRLYRDRLSKAFLFEPNAPQAASNGREAFREKWKRLRVALLLEPGDNPTPADRKPLDRFKLTNLDPQLAPYHLLNTALNIQGSRHVNQRGRNADFFLFSRAYVGSEATGYVSTAAMEKVVPELDLGTALAISGAAASANMGRQSIRPLTPTLALLNVRLGFWLRNPSFVRVSALKGGLAKLREFFSLYFLYELLANLRETNWNVYLTDGGHVENLGAYELLKRRCRVIIAVDAEADPEMTFGSLVTLQRYARIDLGVRINLPWEAIRNATQRVSADFAEKGTAERRNGPHCAIGDVAYPDGGRGLLIYIKSSMTGDENDYILDYKNRYPQFPQESTGDQFFTEEQFEVYRALGFHAAYGLFDRSASFAHLDPKTYPCVPEDLEFLDRLFPPKNGAQDPCEPSKRSAFANVLTAEVRSGMNASERSARDGSPGGSRSGAGDSTPRERNA